MFQIDNNQSYSSVVSVFGIISSTLYLYLHKCKNKMCDWVLWPIVNVLKRKKYYENMMFYEYQGSYWKLWWIQMGTLIQSDVTNKAIYALYIILIYRKYIHSWVKDRHMKIFIYHFVQFLIVFLLSKNKSKYLCLVYYENISLSKSTILFS